MFNLNNSEKDFRVRNFTLTFLVFFFKKLKVCLPTLSCGKICLTEMIVYNGVFYFWLKNRDGSKAK